MKNCFKTNWLKQNKGVQAATIIFWLFGFITGSKVVYYMTDGLLYRVLSWVGGFAFLFGLLLAVDRFFARRVYDKNTLNKLNRYGYALWAVFAILTLGVIAWFEWR